MNFDTYIWHSMRTYAIEENSFFFFSDWSNKNRRFRFRVWKCNVHNFQPTKIDFSKLFKLNTDGDAKRLTDLSQPQVRELLWSQSIRKKQSPTKGAIRTELLKSFEGILHLRHAAKKEAMVIWQYQVVVNCCLLLFFELLLPILLFSPSVWNVCDFLLIFFHHSSLFSVKVWRFLSCW